MEASYPIANAKDFPFGLMCCACERIIKSGQPYTEVPDEFIDDEILVLIRCVYC